MNVVHDTMFVMIDHDFRLATYNCQELKSTERYMRKLTQPYVLEETRLHLIAVHYISALFSTS